MKLDFEFGGDADGRAITMMGNNPKPLLPGQPIADHLVEANNLIGGQPGQDNFGTHRKNAGLAPIECDDQVDHEPQMIVVVASEADHRDSAAHRSSVGLANIIAEIREQWRQRQAWHRAEKALTLQAKALCRRLVEGDKKAAEVLYRSALGKGGHDLADVALGAITPLVEGRAVIEAARKAIEKRLAILAKQLPVAPWVDDMRGFGIGSLAAIVGEAGDLSNYSNPAKLWKRMGVAVMGDGKRQRKIGGADALDHGYSPSRRAVMWNIGDSLIKAKSPLKAVYDARKLMEAERVDTKAHAHNRAKRYIEKRLLRDLWAAWRRGGPL